MVGFQLKETRRNKSVGAQFESMAHARTNRGIRRRETRRLSQAEELDQSEE